MPRIDKSGNTWRFTRTVQFGDQSRAAAVAALVECCDYLTELPAVGCRRERFVNNRIAIEYILV